uniref:Uncharacterized protein n=1 Tax=Fagus sylvatica TaxID=28930 RepID=A0A2N9FUJ1_FAGSY
MKIIERLKVVAQEGNIDGFYMLIREDVKLLGHMDELPFVDTPLHIAASVGHIPFAMEMMRLKPSFAKKSNPDGFSPIHLALQNGHIELVHRLVQVDRDLVRVKGRKGITPLHYAAALATDDQLDLLAGFLSACPNSIEDFNIQNETALHIALKSDKLEAFKLLVGWLVRNTSTKAMLRENAMYFERMSYMNRRHDEECNTVLHRKVLNWKDMEGNTVLHIAVSKNQTEVVRHLLACGGENANVHIKNLEGKTAWDILQEQTQVDNSEIKDMLRDAKPLM